MKILRVLLSLLALLVLVIIIAVAGLYLFIDANKLKPIIIAGVKRQTGYQLAIPGKLTWDFYPRFSIRVQEMSITAPKGTKPFANLRKVKIRLPISHLWRKKTHWEGKVYINDLIFSNLRLNHVLIGIHWLNQKLHLKPIAAALYGGTLSGEVVGNGLATVPNWRWQLELHNIQIKPLLDDSGQNKLQLSGTGNMKLRAVSTGKTDDELLQHMNGNTSVMITQGAVKGVDLNYLVTTADALINSQTVIATDTAETAFEKLSATAVILNGVANTNDILLETTALAATGQGMMNLPMQTLDLKLQITTRRRLQTQWTIPILISGNFSAPTIRIDKEAVEKSIARQELDKVKTQVEDKVNELLPKANDFLQKILR